MSSVWETFRAETEAREKEKREEIPPPLSAHISSLHNVPFSHH